jgi:hypothetical protein
MRNKKQDFEKLAAGMDISPSMYKYAVERYQGMSKFLSESGIDAHFYPQGSFRTGTVVRPLKDGKETDFDIDVVCELTDAKDGTFPMEVKQVVGTTLEGNEEYKSKMRPEEDRCWTLDYANVSGDIGLSMDVVPCVHEDTTVCLRLKSLGVNEAFADKAVAITERKGATNYIWKSSNPGGYGDWFDCINGPFLSIGLHERKERILNENRTMFASVDDVPNYYVRSPLQVCVQILKRHRDLFYAEVDKTGKFRLASVIITTLAAQIASGTEPADIDVLLPHIVEGIDDYSELLQGHRPRNEAYYMQKAFIRRMEKKWVIPNPVNPEDNFADSWTNETAQMFFRWVRAVKEDFVDTSPAEERKYLAGLNNGFGPTVVEKVLNPYASDIPVIHTKVSRPSAITPTKPWGTFNGQG